MKKKCMGIVLLLTGLTFTFAADRFAPSGNTLPDALQWLAVQTGDFTSKDPQDNYQAPDIREYFARQSGNRTRTLTFYGICFDYAQAAYNEITASRSYYVNLGVKAWYIAAAFDSSRQIILYDPVSKEQATRPPLNGVYVAERSQQNVQAHGNATLHGWLWVYGNDGTIYWIDPTWTDSSGYVWWGVVRNGREEQVSPHARLCVGGRIPGGVSFTSFSSGDASRNQGNWNQAIDDYNKAIEVEPNYALIYNNRGLAHYNKGDYDKAIADFNQALQIDPNYADAYRNRGRAYYAKGNHDQALADYNQAITLNPDDAPAYNGRAYVYLVKKDHRQAVTNMREAAKLSPGEATWYVTLGEIYLDVQRYDAAISAFETALRLSPGFTRASELLQRARRRGR